MENFSPENILNQKQEKIKGSLFSLNPLFSLKTLFIILGLVILVEIVMAGRIFFNSTPPSLGVVLQPLSSGKIVLITPQKQYQINEEIPVTIRLFTGGYETDGADVILKYDPEILEGSPSSVITHDLYSDYPFKLIDKGLVQISGINSSSGFNGMGNFATVTFKAQKVGKVTISVEFLKGRTDESNITKSRVSEDILDSVQSLDIDVTQNASDNNRERLGCSEAFYQSCMDASGKSGAYWCSSITDGNNCKIGCFKDQKLQALGCRIEGS